MSRNPRTAFTGWPSGALKAPTGMPKKARNIRLDPSISSQSDAMVFDRSRGRGRSDDPMRAPAPSRSFYNPRGVRLSIDVEQCQASRVLGEAINRRSLFEAMTWAESDKTGDAHDDASMR